MRAVFIALAHDNEISVNDGSRHERICHARVPAGFSIRDVERVQISGIIVGVKRSTDEAGTGRKGAACVNPPRRFQRAGKDRIIVRAQAELGPGAGRARYLRRRISKCANAERQACDSKREADDGGAHPGFLPGGDTP